MACYTCVTSNRGHTHVSQHFESNPEGALKKHLSELPFFEGINPIGDELYWLQSIALGKQSITMELKKENTWKWNERENYSPVYTTYIIKTESKG